MNNSQTAKKNSPAGLHTNRIIIVYLILAVVIGVVYWLTATRHAATTTASYKIVNEIKETDPHTKASDTTLYVTESITPSTNKNALNDLAMHIKATSCTVAACGIEFYATEKAAGDAYTFDISRIQSEPSLLLFNKHHPGITEATIDSQFIAEYINDSLTTHPLRQNAGQSTPDKTAPANATALCVDGTYSFSQHRSGACGVHQGITKWY